MAEKDFNSGDIPGNPPPAAKTPGPSPRKKRRIILKIVGLVVIGLVLLILAAPTLIGTRPFFSVILGQVNNHLNGKVEVSSLSLGWFTGVKIEGVRVVDASGAQIAELDHAAVPLPLWKLITGNLSLGEVPVDGLSFDAKIDSNGQLNFAQLVKSSPATPAPSNAPAVASESKSSKLPNISGDLKLTNCRGTFSQAGKPTVYLTKLDGEIKIPSINQPITDQFTIGVWVGDQTEGMISIGGSASVISGNQIALNLADIHQILNVNDLDLMVAKPFIPDSVGVSTLDGSLAAKVTLDVTGGKTADVDASISAMKPIAIGGQILQGDTYSTNTFAAAIPKLSAVFPDGLDHWQTGRIKVGAEAGSAPISVKVDQGQVAMLADLTPQAILNLIAHKKPGSAGQLVVTSNFDLAKIIPQLKHTLPQTPGTTIQAAGFTENTKLVITPDKAELTNTTDTTKVIGTQTVQGAPSKQISIDPINISVNATDLGGGGSLPNIHNMSVKIQGGGASGQFQGQTLSDLNGALTIDLNVLRDELSQFIDLKNTNFGGTILVRLSEDGIAQAPYKGTAHLNVTGTNLHYSDAAHPDINESSVQLDATADVQGSMQNTVDKINTLSIALKAGDANLATALVTNATVSLAAKSVFDQLQSAHWQLDIPDLKSVMDLANKFSATAPVAAKPDPSAPKPPPALQITGGAIAMSGDISHDNSMMKISVGDLTTKDVAFERGQIKYAAKPVDVKMIALIQAGDQIEQVQITQLTGDLSIATLSMTVPISISQLSSNPIVSGGIQLAGNLTDLTQLLSALQGETPDAYPERGNYVLSENIGSQQDTITLKGGIQITKFETYKGNTVTFSENQISIGNDVSITTIGNDESVAINALTAAMQSSGAANLSLKNGSIKHLQSTRDMQLQLNVNYDLGKLWPIVQPMMGDQYKTLKIAGQFQKQFNVTGSYPANQPSTVAIKTLHADGDLAVASFDYDGLSMQNFILPFTLDNGQLVTVYVNKPTGQNMATPATANGGTVDLGDITLDLTQDPMRLTIPQNKPLIRGLTINPLFADTFMAKFFNNPLFTGNNSATGRLDLTMVDCNVLPLGDLLKKTTPDNTGKADMLFSLTDLNIGYSGISGLSSALKQDSFNGNVKDATVSVAKGISTQNISFVSGQYSLNFNGKVRLADEAMIPLVLDIGPLPVLLGRIGVHDQNILKVVPDRVSVQLEGTVDHANVRLDKTITKILKDAAVKGGLNRLLGGDKNNGGDKSNPLGGFLKGLQK